MCIHAITCHCSQLQVGSALYGMLIKTAKIPVAPRDQEGNLVRGAEPVMEPAFWHQVIPSGKSQKGYAGCHEEVLRTLDILHSVRGSALHHTCAAFST